MATGVWDLGVTDGIQLSTEDRLLYTDILSFVQQECSCKICMLLSSWQAVMSLTANLSGAWCDATARGNACIPLPGLQRQAKCRPDPTPGLPLRLAQLQLPGRPGRNARISYA